MEGSWSQPKRRKPNHTYITCSNKFMENMDYEKHAWILTSVPRLILSHVNFTSTTQKTHGSIVSVHAIDLPSSADGAKPHDL